MTYEQVEAMVEVTGPEAFADYPYVYSAFIPTPSGGKILASWNMNAADDPRFERIRDERTKELVRIYLEEYGEKPV